jgi:hypothetical protein
LKSYLSVILVCFVAFCEGNCAALLTNGFAHNDYEHKRPLIDALDLGFCAVEADIYLVDGQLLVGHDAADLKPERTLTSLYLDPLAQRVRKYGGSVYPNRAELLLLIDVKSEADTTYQQLKVVLTNYSPMLTTFTEKAIRTNAITIIISGNRPTELASHETSRFAAIDGRTNDLDRNPPLPLIPLVSDIWTKFSHWKGKGEIPDADRSRIAELVKRTHEQKRKLRLWAAPDTPESWKLQQAFGIDLINTDKLAEFARYTVARQN